MAEISKITLPNGTTYDLKDSRIPALNSSTTQFLRGDGTWATPSVSVMDSNVDVEDDTTGMIITPSEGGGTPAISIVDTADAGGGVVRTITALDISDTTAAAADVVSGKYFYTSSGVRTAGTASSGPDIPKFTLTLDGGSNISQITCDKTFNEVAAILTGGMGSALVYTPYFDVTDGATCLSVDSTQATYALCGESTVVLQITFASNGTITWVDHPVADRDSSDLTASNLTVTAPAGYYASNATKTLTDANLTAGNIKKDVSIFGVTGSYEGSSGKNIQCSTGRYEVNASEYTATDLSIKVSKAGTYKCYWVMDRNTTSGTSGSQLYNGSTALGSAHTTWSNTNNTRAQECEETLTFAANATITVMARARNSNYYCGVTNFIIVEQ